MLSNESLAPEPENLTTPQKTKPKTKKAPALKQVENILAEVSFQ